MNHTPLACVLAAAAALAGCGGESHNSTAGGPEEANTTAASAQVVLPPSILRSKIYRCKDNSLVYINWLSDNKSANLRTEKNGPPTHLVAPEPGQPMVADGYALTGTSEAKSVTVATPGGGNQSCSA
jgi:hypothetical protein